MIEAVERYKRVCEQITYFSNRATDNFNLFVKLTVATIGGVAWLHTHDQENIRGLLPLARWIVPALAVITAWEIYTDLKSWWGYRVAEADLLEKPELRPKCFESGRRDLVRIAILIPIALAGYCWLR